jgi:hypothetical protein
MVLGVTIEFVKPEMSIVVMPLSMFLGLIVLLRFSLLLPAAAVGRSVKVGQCWQQSKVPGWLWGTLIFSSSFLLLQIGDLGVLRHALAFQFIVLMILHIYRQSSQLELR